MESEEGDAVTYRQIDIAKEPECYETVNQLRIPLELTSAEQEKDRHLDLQPETKVYLIFKGSETIGTIRFIEIPLERILLTRFVITEQHRGKGLGSRIVKDMTKEFFAKNFTVVLYCDKKLIPMYERLNYKTTGSQITNGISIFYQMENNGIHENL